MIPPDDEPRILLAYEHGCSINELCSRYLVSERELRSFLRHRGYNDEHQYKRIGSYPKDVMGVVRGVNRKHEELIGGGAWN